MAGRQRLPLFFYSDFIDVGYAYHWIRPPQELVASDGDTFEGVKVRYTNHIGSWDWSAEAYYGAGEEDVDGIDIKSENQHGVVLKANNDWLTVRGTWSKAESTIDSEIATYSNQGTDDEPLEYTFMGLAALMTFGDVFVVTEYTQGKPNDAAFPAVVFPTTDPAALEVNGREKSIGWYVSTGIRLGDFTPHITYSASQDDYDTSFAQFEAKSSAITVGVRWDFHPSAALKLEYLTRSDKSDDYFENEAGSAGVVGLPFTYASGNGYGDPAEVDLIAFSLDVIF